VGLPQRLLRRLELRESSGLSRFQSSVVSVTSSSVSLIVPPSIATSKSSRGTAMSASTVSVG
jgi:hypothetical protein